MEILQSSTSCSSFIALQAGKLKFFGIRPSWVVSHIAYTKFHSPRPVFHSPGQIFTCIGERTRASFPACFAWLCLGHWTIFDSSWPSYATWCNITWSTLVQVMACAWRDQAIAWTNVDKSSERSSDNPLRPISLHTDTQAIKHQNLLENYF